MPARIWPGITPKINLGSLDRWHWQKAYRHLPLRTWDEQIGVEIPWMRESIAHSEFDDYWRRFRLSTGLTRSVPPI